MLHDILSIIAALTIVGIVINLSLEKSDKGSDR